MLVMKKSFKLEFAYIFTTNQYKNKHKMALITVHKISHVTHVFDNQHTLWLLQTLNSYLIVHQNYCLEWTKRL